MRKHEQPNIRRDDWLLIDCGCLNNRQFYKCGLQIEVAIAQRQPLFNLNFAPQNARYRCKRLKLLQLFGIIHCQSAEATILLWFSRAQVS